jgi:hypothetical protein
MRPNPSDPERTVSVAIVATRLRSERLGELRPEKALLAALLDPLSTSAWPRRRHPARYLVLAADPSGRHDPSVSLAVGELLERDAHLEAVRAAQAAGGRLVLLAAEAGGGKTALVRAFCGTARARILSGACDPLFTQRPLGPFADIAAEVGGELARAVDEGPERTTCSLRCSSSCARSRRCSCSGTSTGLTRRRSTSCGCSDGALVARVLSWLRPTGTTSSGLTILWGAKLGSPWKSS